MISDPNNILNDTVADIIAYSETCDDGNIKAFARLAERMFGGKHNVITGFDFAWVQEGKDMSDGMFDIADMVSFMLDMEDEAIENGETSLAYKVMCNVDTEGMAERERAQLTPVQRINNLLAESITKAPITEDSKYNVSVALHSGLILATTVIEYLDERRAFQATPLIDLLNMVHDYGIEDIFSITVSRCDNDGLYSQFVDYTA